MLRLAVIALLLANAGYYAWSQGWLRSWGLAPVEQSEPHRLAQQIRPETLRILPARDIAPMAPATANEALAAPSSGTVCLQAGLLEPRQADAVRTAAAALPQGSWSLQSTAIPGRWMVYMGRFADDEALAKKRAELRTRNVPYDRPNNPALEPGLSLGRFATEEAAQRALTTLSSQGVRTAKVVVERAETQGFTLRLPALDSATRAQAQALLRPALGDKELRTCP
ncbi:sporulation protein [Acidovorax carolinensis]|uniref:Sporulation protein n=1 Tax=Acidovorax carolinensis TaxID=553814 RepID=A0A240UG64_9BURK|nr:SPOR domain-containing protein [Acidovorax carolinensis]ART53914.1 sporulation protein [Acidovorax carolinensis]ART60491.1 sporulation protein [Acidovorax carolinensis]